MKNKVKLSGWEVVEVELGYTSIVTVHLCALLQELRAVEGGGNQSDVALTQVGDEGLSIGST